MDGDTLAIGSEKVRLQGIDAPETDQVCLNASGIRWSRGIDARDQFVAHVAGRMSDFRTLNLHSPFQDLVDNPRREAISISAPAIGGTHGSN